MTIAQIQAAIAAAIYENTAGDITATALKNVLLAMTEPEFPVAASIPVGGLKPNTLYELGVIGSTTITLAAGTAGMLNHYYFTFDTGGTAPSITWPAVTWGEGSAPTINANKHYEVSILDGYAFVKESEINA